MARLSLPGFLQVRRANSQRGIAADLTAIAPQFLQRFRKDNCYCQNSHRLRISVTKLIFHASHRHSYRIRSNKFEQHFMPKIRTVSPN